MLLQQIVSSRWFRITDLFLVVSSGFLWMLTPKIGILPILALALLPPLLRVLVGLSPFKKTPLDWLVAVFFLTAWIGYWAAYDREAAWSKVWFIVLSVLLYYSLAAQPKENLDWISAFLFCIGLGVAIYFLLTQDFVAFPRKIEFVNKIGFWIMKIIPRMGWTPIHPNYVAGIVTITTLFVLYPARNLAKERIFLSSVVWWLILVGCGIALFAVVMSTSRGAVMAIASAFGGWIIWRIINLNGGRLRFTREAVFPSLVIAFLCAVILFLYLGPANMGNVFSGSSNYGTGSRGELVGRSLYLLLDFPFTGGGLASFPGLYSRYILDIPSFYVQNSHNLFLDVSIEQGVLGGFSVLLVFLMSIWFVARTVAKTGLQQTPIFSWIVLCALITAFVHGMVDDYLYNGPGTLLLLSLAGLSIIEQPSELILDPNKNRQIPYILTILLAGFFLVNLNNVRAVWDANFGAVQMAKVELAGFPTNKWSDSSVVSDLQEARASLHSALQADPGNRTANHRLGLIALLQQDFPSAVAYLEKANRELPSHRGIIKSLGYSYTWLGEMEQATLLLRKIPEARDELEVYTWWWGIHGRPDLVEKASVVYSILEKQPPQE